MGFPGVSVVKNLLANAGATKDAGSISGWGRTPGEGNGNPLQYSCLGNPTDRSLAGSSPWVARVGHDLATKQANKAMDKYMSLCSYTNMFL